MQRQDSRRVTLRSILIGIVLAVFISLWIPYNVWVVRGTFMDFEHVSASLMAPFLFFVIVVNGLLRRFRPDAAFSTSELLVVLSFGLIASTVPSHAFMSYFIGVITTPYYFASPENQWVEVFFQYLPAWLLVDPADHTIRWFYEGLPAYAHLPWRPWIVPLFWWGTFFIALFFAGSCLVVILRKQWIVHEKLSFPLAQVLSQIIEDPGGRSFLPAFMRGRLFWIGFSLPLAVIGWNMVDYFTPVGVIPIGQPYATDLIIGHLFPAIKIKVNIYLFCFALFSPVDILFSIWVFHLFAILESGGMNAVGLLETGASPDAAVRLQEIGALIVFVLWGFWIARRHLWDVARKALGRAPEVDDSEEFFSYRAAVLGVALGVAYMAAFLHMAGMSFVIMAPFLLLLFIFYVGVARIVAETGLVALDLPMNSHEFLIRGVGSSGIDPSSLTVFGLTNAFARNWKTFTMVSVSHVTRLGDRVWTDKKLMFAVICGAFALAFLVGAAYTVYSGYETVGASQFDQWAFTTGNIHFFESVKIWIQNPTRMSAMETAWFFLGGLLMMALIFLRYKFPGWPLHPVGLTIARGVAIDNGAFTLFLAWAVKVLLLRSGGMSLFRRAQPLIMGMLVGFCAGLVLSNVVDIIWFPGQGHRIHGW